MELRNLITGLCVVLVSWCFSDCDAIDTDIFSKEPFRVPFGNANINVWQDSRGRFYISPLAIVDPESSQCVRNKLTRQNELRFTVVLWSEESKDAVYRFVKQMNKSLDVQRYNIIPVPMVKTKLNWRLQVPEGLSFQDQWLTNTRLNKALTAIIVCDYMQICDNARNTMRSDPKSYHALELNYVASPKRSLRRTVRIDSNHLMNEAMRLRLQRLDGAPEDSSMRYINAQEKRDIILHALTEILAAANFDMDYTASAMNIERKIELFFRQRVVSTSDFTPVMWASTFWDPIEARPDKQVKMLNKILAKVVGNSRLLAIVTNSTAVRLWAARMGLEDLFSVRNNTSNNTISLEEVKTLLGNARISAEWYGDRFIVKPIDLYRLNLATLKSSETVGFGSVVLSRYEDVHTVPITFRQNTTANHSSEIPPVVKNRLTEKLNRLETMVVAMRNETTLRNSELVQLITADMLFGNIMFSSFHEKTRSPAYDLMLDYQVRLVNGSNDREGRIEITRNGETGTVCDDGWDINAATVLCRMLGFSGPGINITNAGFGQGSGDILLDDVKCTGDEAHIDLCQHQRWGEDNCGHNEDAGVICSGGDDSSLNKLGNYCEHKNSSCPAHTADVISVTTKSSPFQCQEACSNTPYCLSFDWNESAKKCGLHKNSCRRSQLKPSAYVTNYAKVTRARVVQSLRDRANRGRFLDYSDLLNPCHWLY